jgi:hypothetical protein
LLAERRLQSGIARQTEYEVNAVRLAPPHQRVVGKAAVGTQDDVHPRPLMTNLRYDARHLLDRAIAPGDVRTPLSRQQQVPAAEHVERQITVLVVVAVEEAALLPAVERHVGIVEIEHDLARRTLMRLAEKLDEQRIDLCPIAIDLVILRAMALRRMLKTIERALARQSFAIRPQNRMQFPGQNRKGGILAQLVVIVEILVAQHQAEDPLPQQRLDLVFDIARVAPIAEALGKPTHQPEAPIHLPQQQRTPVRRDVAAIETGHHRTPLNRFKFEQLRATLRLHRGISLDQSKIVAAQQFSQSPRPDALQ